MLDKLNLLSRHLYANGGDVEGHTIAEAAAEIIRLRAELADIKESFAQTVSGECGFPDEKHCSCVPALRQAITDMEVDIGLLTGECYRLGLGHDRYEFIRALNLRKFADIWLDSINGKGNFDDLVDLARAGLPLAS